MYNMIPTKKPTFFNKKRNFDDALNAALSAGALILLIYGIVHIDRKSNEANLRLSLIHI